MNILMNLVVAVLYLGCLRVIYIILYEEVCLPQEDHIV